MQGRVDPQRELLDAGSVAGHLLPAGSVFAFLAEHRETLFPDSLFTDLFPSGRGRPSVPSPVVATVMVLQALQGLSDREAADAVTFDLRWKTATGLPVQAESFHPTVLTYWRRRLAGSERPQRIFDAVRDVIASTGVVRGKTRRALDSTVLDDAVATQDTITQLMSAVRRVARVVPGGDAVVASAATRLAGVAGHGYERVGKPLVAWDDPAAQAALVDALVRDARAVLAALPAGQEGAAADAVGLLALVAGQDVELVTDPDDPGAPGSWRIAERVAPDRVISTVDPDARHAHKTVHHRRDGFKAHVVVEPETGIITGAQLTKAAGADAADGTVGMAVLAADTTVTGPVQVLADSAYGTGNALAVLAEAGHEAVIKPWPLRPAVPGGFTLDDFAVDETTGTVTCPQQVTRPIPASRSVTFGIACRDCPLRAGCTTSRTGRSLQLHPHHGLQRQHRRDAADPDFQVSYRHYRPLVERGIAWVVARGNRRVRYRGVAKNNAWLHLRIAGLNLRRLTTLGLHQARGTWALS